MFPNFTPLTALLGGALIGLAAVLLLRLTGRIAGISGILNGVFASGAGDRLWRVAFVLGLIGGAAMWFQFDPTPSPQREAFSPVTLIVAGLLVGAGTRLGNGCTSGHGICGLARLSRRSLIAVVTFMGAGFVTVAFARHVLAGVFA
jgi:uncharacterized membrane protein YedE/YeeE